MVLGIRSSPNDFSRPAKQVGQAVGMKASETPSIYPVAAKARIKQAVKLLRK
jgi:hypothetical protein